MYKSISLQCINTKEDIYLESYLQLFFYLYFLTYYLLMSIFILIALNIPVVPKHG